MGRVAGRRHRCTAEPELPKPDTISAYYTAVGVSMGDHAQDIVKVIEVGEAETVRELMDRLFPHSPSAGRTMAYRSGSRHENYLMLRFSEPVPAVESVPDGEPF